MGPDESDIMTDQLDLLGMTVSAPMVNAARWRCLPQPSPAGTNASLRGWSSTQSWMTLQRARKSVASGPLSYFDTLTRLDLVENSQSLSG